MFACARRLSAFSVVLCVLTTLFGAVTVSDAPQARADNGVTNIMVYGDSVTIGTTGDYTWRYFLDRGLRAGGVPFDLVGPNRGLYDEASGTTTSAYADPAFDQDHAAVWGNLLHPYFSKLSLSSALTGRQVDALVIFMGGNDMFFLNLTPDEVVEQLRLGVELARAQNPAVKVVLVANHHTGDARIPVLNAKMFDLVNQISTPASPVAYARVPDWNPATDTWEGAHPSQVGSFKLGVAVTDALASIGVGSAYPRPLVPPAEGLRTAGVLSGAPFDTGAALTWTNPAGATATRIWRRNATAGGPWEILQDKIPGTAWVDTGLVNGTQYDYRLQSWKYRLPAQDLYSASVSVVPASRAAPPAPGTPAAGPALSVPVPVATPGLHRVDVDWPDVPGATSYLVWWRDRDAGQAWHITSTVASAFAQSSLRGGALHDVVITARGDSSQSLPADPVSVTVPGVIVHTTGVRAVAKGKQLTVRWRREPAATSYQLRYRAGKTWTVLQQSLVVPRHTLRVSSYGLRVQVRALDGLQAGPWSPPVKVTR